MLWCCECENMNVYWECLLGPHGKKVIKNKTFEKFTQKISIWVLELRLVVLLEVGPFLMYTRYWLAIQESCASCVFCLVSMCVQFPFYLHNAVFYYIKELYITFSV